MTINVNRNSLKFKLENYKNIKICVPVENAANFDIIIKVIKSNQPNTPVGIVPTYKQLLVDNSSYFAALLSDTSNWRENKET